MFDLSGYFSFYACFLQFSILLEGSHFHSCRTMMVMSRSSLLISQLLKNLLENGMWLSSSLVAKIFVWQMRTRCSTYMRWQTTNSTYRFYHLWLIDCSLMQIIHLCTVLTAVSWVYNEQCGKLQILPFSNAFYRGLTDLISPSWLKLFNASEFNQVSSFLSVLKRFFWVKCFL